jgi:hypothetical protein
MSIVDSPHGIAIVSTCLCCILPRQSVELLRLKVYGDIPKNSLTSFADPLSASFERVGPSAVADILVLFDAGEVNGNND